AAAIAGTARLFGVQRRTTGFVTFELSATNSSPAGLDGFSSNRAAASLICSSVGRLASFPRYRIECAEAARANLKWRSHSEFGPIRYEYIYAPWKMSPAPLVSITSSGGTLSAGMNRSFFFSSYQSMPFAPMVTAPILQPRDLR